MDAADPLGLSREPHQVIGDSVALAVTRMEIPDVLSWRAREIRDSRGHFREIFSRASLEAAGLSIEFVQENETHSEHAGTIRGLHFQAPPFSQAKLVRVLRGAVLDVAVDLRRASSTFGRWCATEIAADGRQVFIPAGFAHGFCTLVDHTTICYKIDAPYAPASEAGIRWNDADLAIAWPDGADAATLSARDRSLPPFGALVSPF